VIFLYRNISLYRSDFRHLSRFEKRAAVSPA